MDQRNSEDGAGWKPPANWNGRVLPPVPAEWNAVTSRIIGCAMEVHSILGPSLLERLYEEAMVHELRQAGMHVECQVPIAVPYKGMRLEGQRVDLVVENLVIVELKSVERVADVHLAQLVSYLRSARMPLGLLINFNTMKLKDGLFRRICPQSVSARLSRHQDDSLSSSGSL